MPEIHDRKKLIDYLLRRQFGSLAPPPVPTLSGMRVDAMLDKASWKRDLAMAGRSNEATPMEKQRARYEAMSLAELNVQVEAAKSNDLEKAKQLVEEAKLSREKRWPHWAKKDLWSEAELAALCCGFVPDERGMPNDPGRVNGSDQQAIAILRAGDDIRRGTLSQRLAFVPRDDADSAARMYGTARHFVPSVAAEWAAQQFDTFPASLLAAVRERARSNDADLAAIVPVPEIAPKANKPLDERERTTLLCVIGALARHANLDLSQHMKAGDTIAAIVPELQLTGRTIGEHLKKVGEAMEKRTK
ncbi:MULTISPECIES: hypothetical protein [Xanthomonas]|uniref:Uncharacterized protein n=2 Tax=Xanthomonas TaxID=338 RepID=A0ABX3LWA4_9XANT|nr:MULTISPECIES: hypothetical protein [Xanthomonas]KAB0537916.1 hypothetical protein F7R02_06005 [Xanthomonas cissicola]MCW0375147.1 hypothetical protein [Xanthomonas sacchari]OOW59846.1 hypothetical protein Xant_10880 [Xanthomonas cissicola]OOX13029.1 hypothetical protein Xcaj_09670 [Xanthomonas axonopodis pv. cajani]